MENFTFQIKPLKDAVWNGIPRFAVVSGPNGVGKSRALDEMGRRPALLIKNFPNHGSQPHINSPSLMYYKHEEAILAWLNEENPAPSTEVWNKVALLIKGKCSRPYTAEAASKAIPRLYDLPSSWLATPLGAFVSMCSDDRDSRSQLVTAAMSNVSGIVAMLRADEVTPEGILDRLSDVRDRRQLAEKYVAQQQQSERPEAVLNGLLRELEFPFEVRYYGHPGDQGIHFARRGEASPKEWLQSSQLSDGQWLVVFVAIIQYFVTCSVQKVGVQTLLFDEPDRHLDPKLCKVLIETLRRVSDSVQVILTTHRLDTVALTEEGELFELTVPSSTGPLQFKQASKPQVACRMAYNVPSLGLRMRVHVEAPDDVCFYHSLYRRLLSWVCGEAEGDDLQETLGVDHLLSTHFQMVFVSNAKEKGGCTQVAKSIMREMREVEELAELELLGSGIFSHKCFHQPFGIMDLDNGAPVDQRVASRVVRGQRYAVENYLLDPLFLAFLPEDQLKHLLAEDYECSVGEVLNGLRVAVEEERYDAASKFVKDFFVTLASASTKMQVNARKMETTIDRFTKKITKVPPETDPSQIDRFKKKREVLRKDMKDLLAVAKFLESASTGTEFTDMSYFFNQKVLTFPLPTGFLKCKAKALRKALFGKSNLESVLGLFSSSSRENLPPLPLDLVKLFFQLDSAIRKQVHDQVHL